MQQYTTNPYQKYRQSGVMSAGPMDLIVMLYDGCIKHMKLGAIHIKDGKIEKAHESLLRAQEIITELLNSLDDKYEVSEGLKALYNYTLGQLELANFFKDAEKLEPLIDMITQIRDTWTEVLKQNRHEVFEIEEDSGDEIAAPEIAEED